MLSLTRMDHDQQNLPLAAAGTTILEILQMCDQRHRVQTSAGRRRCSGLAALQLSFISWFCPLKDIHQQHTVFPASFKINFQKKPPIKPAMGNMVLGPTPINHVEMGKFSLSLYNTVRFTPQKEIHPPKTRVLTQP